MKNGKIGVTTENIFPVIKKFLYSDHEIFLRELISNAVDATQKLKTLSSIGEMKGDLGDLTIRVSADKDAKTLTVTDRGIGMTAEEVDKYINQIAFSGAEEFMEKYKNQAIIGHFGLGFYSSFMVADKVEIITKSWKEGAKTVRWSCTGTPEFEMEETDQAHDRGTTIVLHLSEDALEYAEDSKVEGLLRKYCRFLPIPIAFGKVKEWKDGKYVDTDKDNVINNVDPLWTRKPADITEEQYKEFYHELYPMSDEPLFSIHLNIDYPFHLTGILYFPKIHNNFEIQKNKIQLYSNQVYVTDQVEGIVPEYLTLLHGVIDSPDIPLNVSRSYLQSDANVKKISNYITRKVADRLQELFNTMRPEFEKKWDDLKIFIQYGILTDEKFAEKAQDFMLWKNVEGKYFTPKEYLEKVKENQTDKNKTVVLLYVDDPVEKHTFLEAARGKGYDVLLCPEDVDEFCMMSMNSFDERPLKNVAGGDLDLETEDEKEAAEAITKENEGLFNAMKEALDGAVTRVAVSTRLSDTPAAVTTEGPISLEMERMMAMGPDGERIKADRVLEINPQHRIFDVLKQAQEAGDTEKIAQYSTILYNQALIVENMPVDDPIAYAQAVTALME